MNKKKLILIADDEIGIHESLRIYLTREDYEVYSVFPTVSFPWSGEVSIWFIRRKITWMRDTISRGEKGFTM